MTRRQSAKAPTRRQLARYFTDRPQAHASRAVLELAPWSMRPPAIRSTLLYYSPHNFIPFGAAGPVLHRLVTHKQQKRQLRQPPSSASRVFLRDLLCSASSRTPADLVVTPNLEGDGGSRPPGAMTREFGRLSIYQVSSFAICKLCCCRMEDQLVSSSFSPRAQCHHVTVSSLLCSAACCSSAACSCICNDTVSGC